jgi:hypothetical protein
MQKTVTVGSKLEWIVEHFANRKDNLTKREWYQIQDITKDGQTKSIQVVIENFSRGRADGCKSMECHDGVVVNMFYYSDARGDGLSQRHLDVKNSKVNFYIKT